MSNCTGLVLVETHDRGADLKFSMTHHLDKLHIAVARSIAQHDVI